MGYVICDMGMQEIELSKEQQALLEHPVSFHGRLLAGPGTGKSFTATLWLGQLHRDAGRALRSKMLTFTRAATAEFAEKLATAGLADVVDAPATVHSHALSVLMGMHGHGLPVPLRIPDSWETKTLIRPQLSRFLRASGYDEATPRVVENLEREMAAGWETLDPGVEMLADVDPDLRAAYVGTWKAHRASYGYSLLAELPYQAGVALEDLGEDQPPRVDLLLVDEYQDLNAADIRLVAAHAALGVKVVAIGDDDQSIYGWRYADPAGIRRFCDDFQPNYQYTLTISRRCSRRILAAASELIASAPGRLARDPLSTHEDSPDGLFAYLRFANDRSEAKGAAAIAAARVRGGVDPTSILVLVRSKADRWRDEIERVFENEGLTLANVEWVEQALTDEVLRSVIALARLTADPEDSLAWWSLTQGLTPGLGPAFADYVYDNRNANERWGTCLLRLRDAGFPGLGNAASTRASGTIDRIRGSLEATIERMVAWSEESVSQPWSAWLHEIATEPDWRVTLVGDELGPDAERLLDLVGPAVPPGEGILSFLNQLEPVGGDLAAKESGGVRLMTMAKSKGLTADTAIVMGVEEGLVPLGSAADIDEERRLLYVALTRAQRVCVATCAARRHGQLARSGGGTTQVQRRRSPLLEGLSYGRPADGEQFLGDIGLIEQA